MTEEQVQKLRQFVEDNYNEYDKEEREFYLEEQYGDLYESGVTAGYIKAAMEIAAILGIELEK
jgi:hypothetical protein